MCDKHSAKYYTFYNNISKRLVLILSLFYREGKRHNMPQKGWWIYNHGIESHSNIWNIVNDMGKSFQKCNYMEHFFKPKQ